MEETYVYIKVKLSLKDGQTESSIDDIVSSCDYSFSHDEIVSHEITDIYDIQIPKNNNDQLTLNFDLDKDTEDYYGELKWNIKK